MKQAVHPDCVMRELFGLMNTVGTKKFLRGTDHKPKEKFIGCLFSYAIRKFTEKDWFINQLQEPASSDFTLTTYTERPITEKPAETACVQLVELPERINNEPDKIQAIHNIIDKKYSDLYQYERGTMLLIFGNFEGVDNYLDNISDYIINKQANNKYAMVWFIYLNSVDIINSFIYSVSILWPMENRANLKIVLKDEFGKGVIFHNKYFDKFLINSQDDERRDSL